MKRAKAMSDAERTDSVGKPVRNKILLSVSDAEYRRICPHLKFVSLAQGRILHAPSKKLQFVYFPNGGLVSIVVASQGGRGVEAGVVGYEGAVGTALTVGLSRSPLRHVVQIAGNGFRLSASALQSILPITPNLQMRLSRYAVLQGMQVAQTAACNRLHELKERLARWLLMAQDRVDSGILHITHEFLATMLGTDRPSVSIAAGALQSGNAIHYTRGRVEIVNRRKLESFACDCYRVIHELNHDLGL